MDTYLPEPASLATEIAAGGMLDLTARWCATTEGLAVRDALVDLGASSSEVEWILATAGSGFGVLFGLPSQIPDPRRFAQIRLQAWRCTYPSAAATE